MCGTKRVIAGLIAVAIVIVVAALAVTLRSGAEDPATASPVAATGAEGTAGSSPVTVAFIGDQGLGSDARAVLELIRDEGADMVLHQGDFDYRDDPVAWDLQIDETLGRDFPYFASVGNHDLNAWLGYQNRLQERLDRVEGATCEGDLGVNASCRYLGLFFILSGAGTLGSNHEDFLRSALAEDTSPWRICTWHKNQRAAQIGGKEDAVGWEPYEICRREGAIIATGHEHSYERTLTMGDINLGEVDSTCPDDPATPDPDVCVGPGSTFLFVSGLGGQDIRDQERCFPITYPHGCNGEWAKIYAEDQGAQFGALFITFDLASDVATGYFKTIDGDVVDSFTITRR